MKTRNLFIGLALTTAIPAALSFAAATSANTAQQQATPATAPWLSIAQVHSQLEAAGYRNIEKIEREHGNYEVKATNREGQRVKLHVHPQTGAVLDLRRHRHEEKLNAGEKKLGKPGVECNKRRCRDDLPDGGAQP